MISANIIADSVNPQGKRITTLIATFPRMILAEFNTHRALSKSSASSRAIPFNKMLKMVENNPFVPIAWMKDHSGMQGKEFFISPTEIENLKFEWYTARDYAIQQAMSLSTLGLTKQIVNRLLEPFMWHTAIVTGTEWENFTALRADSNAEIHMEELAWKILDSLNASTPKQLQPGQWHIPFGDKFDEERIEQLVDKELVIPGNDYTAFGNMLKVKIATARCARVSYLNFEGKDDYQADLDLHDRLMNQGHWSAFEHCAKVMNADEHFNSHKGSLMQPYHTNPNSSFGWCGNFQGFIQYRKLFSNENRSDDRLKKVSL